MAFLPSRVRRRASRILWRVERSIRSCDLCARRDGPYDLVHLLTAKTREAPVKTLSLPLELFCCLRWLAKPAYHWATFVANKVTKTTESTEAANWSHVQSEYNPADLASRGVHLQELVDNPFWWHRPTRLQRPRNQWPSQGTDFPVTEVDKRAFKAHVASMPTEDFLDLFSKLDRALRVPAFVHRFV